ncbi:MAG: ribose 5-phosphate isomerase A [Holdemanella sp.]|nr:ribose 5-phosphate isomerase A [Holdemanella sp.]
MNLKKKGAEYALRFIKDGMVIGLGGGRTIQYLAQYIKEKNLDVKVVTPSMTTALTCKKMGLTMLPTYAVGHIDLAFDSCDEIDENFYALKSGGGIHTHEKIIASMADHYILMVDDSKYGKTLRYTHPVVLEVLKDAYSYVCNKLDALGYIYTNRETSNKDGILISDNGNLLIDVQVQEYTNPETLYNTLIQITGIVEISIFTSEITDIILTRENEIKHIIRA